jgi:hypothetical protein
MQRVCYIFPGKKVGIVALVGMPSNLIRDSFSTQRMILPCRSGKFLHSPNSQKKRSKKKM